MTRGWPLFVLICVLAVMPLVNRTLGQIALVVLALLYLLTLTSIKRTPSLKQRETVQAGAEDPAKPKIRRGQSA